MNLVAVLRQQQSPQTHNYLLLICILIASQRGIIHSCHTRCHRIRIQLQNKFHDQRIDDSLKAEEEEEEET